MIKKAFVLVLKIFIQGFFWFSGALFAFLILFFIIKQFLGFDRLGDLKNSLFASTSLKTQELGMSLKELIAMGKVISFDSFFTQTLAYYDTIITILIGILGIVVAGAFLYIRYTSQEKSEEYARAHIDNFLAKKDFNDQVMKYVDKKVNDKVNDDWGEDIGKSLEEVRELNQRLNERVSLLEEESRAGADESIGRGEE